MFKKIIGIFQKVEEDNNRWSAEFLEFYRECVETFPRSLKNRLAEQSIRPCIKGESSRKSDAYTVNFKMSDVLWWEGIIETINPYFKEPKIFKREVLMAALDALDDLKLPDDQYQKYLKEIGSELNTLK
jgi:hypothetical protein